MRLVHLLAITDAMPISQLSEDQIKELQRALAMQGYPVGAIDGLAGPKTRNAWAEFKTDEFMGHPDLIGPDSIKKLQELVDRTGTAHDFSTKQGVIRAIRDECQKQGIGLTTQTAYVLATVEWETAQKFMPVREAFWLSEAWRRDNLRYYPYYGRGFVQLTWRNNYASYSEILNIDLVSNPDLALGESVALFVLVHGFKTGTFTGRKISDFINASGTDFVLARRCINGRDHASDIAHLAEKYLANP